VLLEAHSQVESTGDYRELFAEFGIACVALPPESPTVASLRRDGWRTAAVGEGWMVMYPISS
jgi:hypothetical protein